MRVLVGVAQDADHLDPVAADLLGDVAIEILRRHQLERRGGLRGGRKTKRETKRQQQGEGEGFHKTSVFRNMLYYNISDGGAKGAGATPACEEIECLVT